MNELALMERPATDIALAIATATTGELKEYGAQAEALRAHAKKVKDRTAEIKALEARTRIERRFGVLIREAKAEGLIAEGAPVEGRIRLENLGLTRNQSSDFQQLAEIPDADFEEWLRIWKSRFKKQTDSFPSADIRWEWSCVKRAAEEAEERAKHRAKEEAKWERAKAKQARLREIEAEEDAREAREAAEDAVVSYENAKHPAFILSAVLRISGRATLLDTLLSNAVCMGLKVEGLTVTNADGVAFECDTTGMESIARQMEV